ncbi:outer membrane lipoprotein-sorting protein [Psychromonas ossibalaenae]|uniref:outer membrane lipoprotein-sorting protein n=1 Tax=Psychromonas ossibalaenae TaxID=444922 RepID=UPI0003717120|nr:outer membrane lipoprotein-sorting protein [Psychromonas ossibalaenae]
MLNNISINKLAAAAVFTLVSTSSFALTQEQQGLEISQQVKQHDTGWTDSSADMLMILHNAQGQKSIRELKIKTIEQLTDGDKSLTTFNKPRDVKGTAFLSFSHPVEADDQWLYLPALKRVKRISSRNKSGPFMGSQFAFEDLSSFEIEKYSYKYLGDEVINGLDSFKVEQYPVDPHSGYTRRIVWVDKEAYRIQKIDFYDRKNTLLKTLTYTSYRQYLNQYWRADTLNMVNHQNGKSTELKWKNYTFKSGLKDGDFNKNALKRVR